MSKHPSPTCGVPLNEVLFKLSPVQCWQVGALLNTGTKIPFANCSSSGRVPLCHCGTRNQGAFPSRALFLLLHPRSSTLYSTYDKKTWETAKITLNSQKSWEKRSRAISLCNWPIFLFHTPRVAFHSALNGEVAWLWGVSQRLRDCQYRIQFDKTIALCLWSDVRVSCSDLQLVQPFRIKKFEELKRPW